MPDVGSVLARAQAIFAARAATPTTESAADWAAKTVEARRKAFWSAKLYHAEHVADLKEACLQVLKGDRVKVRDLHSTSWSPAELEEEVDPKTGQLSPGSGFKRGDMTIQMSRSLIITEMRARALERGLDAQSKAGRIQLITEMAVGTSIGQARWEADANNPTGLQVAPARRFVRIEPRKEPRDWDTRWFEAAQAVNWDGVFPDDNGATKIAMFNSPIWVELSAFGNPFPPFDYNSGMGLEDVFAWELDKMGWHPNQPPPPKLDGNVEIDISDLPETEKKWLLDQLGDIGKMDGGKLVIGKGLGGQTATPTPTPPPKIPPPVPQPPPPTPTVAATPTAPTPTAQATATATATSAPKFIPAKTLPEAEQYATAHFARTADYRGMSVDHANKVNEALTDLTERFPVSPIGVVRQRALRGGTYAKARYNLIEIDERKIGAQLDEEGARYAESQAASSRNIQRWIEYYGGRENIPSWERKKIAKWEANLKFSRYNVHESHENHLKGLVAHEYGHVLADQYFGQINGSRANPHASYAFDLTRTGDAQRIQEMQSRWRRAFQKARRTGDIYKLSQYGNKNVNEFFAECFSAHAMGETLPDYIESLMEEVLTNGIM